MEKMELIDELQVRYEGFAKRMKGRIYYDDQETKSLLEGYAEELASFIFKELSKAREEGRKEERDRIFWELDRINCVDEALPKNYSAAGMQFGINKAKEIVLQKELSKLKDNK